MKARLTLWLLVVVWALAGSKRAAPLPARGKAGASAQIAARCGSGRAIRELGSRGASAWLAESLTRVRN